MAAKGSAASSFTPLDILLVFFPITLGLHFLKPTSHTAIFVVSCISIVPLAAWLGRATEHLAARTGEGIGGLLNATFGNAAELIIAIMALRSGLYDIVKASLTGSIIGNVLLVMGAAFLAGGVKFAKLSFNTEAARSQAAMLSVAAVSLVLPASYHELAGDKFMVSEQAIGLSFSCILLLVYALSLVFSLGTHKHLFAGTAAEHDGEGSADGEHWSLQKSLCVLLGSTACIAWVSEILVHSVEHAAHAFGMSGVFIGVIVVAVVGNAAEHSTAILVALKKRMDLSISIAIGSSLQIALFVAPLLVILSYCIGPRPMDLTFTSAEVLAVFASVFLVNQVVNDGKTNWLEGVQLLALYLMLGIIFYYLPA